MQIDSITPIKNDISLHNITDSGVNTDNSASFDSLLTSAMNMVDETNTLQQGAEQAEINYAMGYTDSTHDLAVAQQKANIALQYTVAVRDKVLEAYREIMNMQM